MTIIVTGPPNIDVRARALDVARSQGAVFIGDPTALFCKHQGFQTLYEMPAATQTESRLALLREHRARVEEGHAVFDHSIIGWLADWMRWHWGKTTTEAWDRILDEARLSTRRYVHIEHLEAGPARCYDGHAWLDPGHARQVDRLMRFLYGEFGLDGRVSFVGRAIAA